MRRAVRADEVGRPYRSQLGVEVTRDAGLWVIRDGSDWAGAVALRHERSWLVLRSHGLLPFIVCRLVAAELMRLSLPSLVAEPLASPLCLPAPEQWMYLSGAAILHRRVRLLAIKQLNALHEVEEPLIHDGIEAAA